MVYPVNFLDVSYQKRVDTQYLPILACSGPFLVIKKKQIDENLISEWLE